MVKNDDRHPSDIVFNGSSASCPFCASLLTKAPADGDRIIVLTGVLCGQRGQVIEGPSVDPDVFFVRFDGDGVDETYRLDRKHDLVLPESAYVVPEWMPPASVEDVAAIHHALVYRFADEIVEANPFPLLGVLRSVALSVWQRRLPIDWLELWPMLEAHGWPGEGRDLATTRYLFASELLVEGFGRAPIKAKRMAPMAEPRYLPRNQRR